VCAHPGVKHTTGEPPSHRDCAEFAVRACPFLTQREEERRTIGLPGEISKAPGFGIPHNPGVALLWITKTYRPWPVPEEAVREAALIGSGRHWVARREQWRRCSASVAAATAETG